MLARMVDCWQEACAYLGVPEPRRARCRRRTRSSLLFHERRSDVTSPAPARFGLIGTGWRSAFFARLARQAPDAFAIAGVVSRRPERAAEVAAAWGVPTFGSVEELLAADPEFVIPCVPWG